MTCQLLGLTNQVEVLENMEFSRIAWEYQFDGAEMPHSNAVMYSSDIPHARVDSSITKMLQLIWLDGRRRQRTQGPSHIPAGVAIAASTYDTLLDMEPTQQVNRIAKNTIECKLTFFFIYFIFLRSRCWRPLRVLTFFFFVG